MKIVLIGFMCAGKSTVAKKLGSLLQWPILEMDELILKKTNSKNMHEVFAKGGELLLRETEVAIAQEFIAKGNTIISTGGGVVLNKIILDRYKSLGGKVFFLNASFSTIKMRLENDTIRPYSLDQALSFYHFRQPLYLNYADYVVEVDQKTVDDVASEIVSRVIPNGK